MKKYFLLLTLFIYQTLYAQEKEEQVVHPHDLSVGDTLITFKCVKLDNFISGEKRKGVPFEKFKVIDIEQYSSSYFTIKSYENKTCRRIYIIDELERVYVLDKERIKGFMMFKSLI